MSKGFHDGTPTPTRNLRKSASKIKSLAVKVRGSHLKTFHTQFRCRGAIQCCWEKNNAVVCLVQVLLTWYTEEVIWSK